MEPDDLADAARELRRRGSGGRSRPTRSTDSRAAADQTAAVEAMFALKHRPVDVEGRRARRRCSSRPGGSSISVRSARPWPPATGPVPSRSSHPATSSAPLAAGDDETLGVRCPDDAVARRLAAEVGPIAATSANLHGARHPGSSRRGRRALPRCHAWCSTTGPDPARRRRSCRWSARPRGAAGWTDHEADIEAVAGGRLLGSAHAHRRRFRPRRVPPQGVARRPPPRRRVTRSSTAAPTPTTGSTTPISGPPSAARSSSGEADGGLCVCGSGIGIAMAANKIAGVPGRDRARRHLGPARRAAQRRQRDLHRRTAHRAPGRTRRASTPGSGATFEGGRHAGRVAKLDALGGEVDACRDPRPSPRSPPCPGPALADDPVLDLITPGGRAAEHHAAADRVGELHLPGGHGGHRARSSPTSTARAIPAGATTAATSLVDEVEELARQRVDGAVRRRSRQRPAPLGGQRQHGGLPRPARAGRHGARHEPRPRRSPHPRFAGQLLAASSTTSCPTA